MDESLFYSCLSSATEVEEREGGGRGSDSANNNEIKPRLTDLLPSSNKEGQSKDITKPTTPLHHENNEKTSNANAENNSNSSWSVLSEKERPIVRSITFNRDRTCLIVSTTTGIRVRTLESLHLSLQNLKVDDDGDSTNNNNNNQSHSWMHDVPLPPDGATYAQLLHKTSLLAVVKPSSPRCCFLYNAKNASSPLAALPLSAAVKRVELQRRVLAAMTVDLRLHVFHMTDGGGDVQQQDATDGNNDQSGIAEKKTLRPTLITTLNLMHPTDSPRNVTRGMDGFNAGSYFDLSTKEEEPYLICKSFNGTPGTVRVYDPTIVHSVSNTNRAVSASCNASIGSGRSAISTASSWDNYNAPPTTKKVKRRIHLLTTINAHEHSVTRMLIGGGGGSKEQHEQTFLATVSSKGTTIRVFGLPQGEMLWEWHRGSRACQFHSLSWNGTADRLASYGSSGTIHIFDWQKKKQPEMSSESMDGEDDSRDFEKVHDDAGPRVFDKTNDSKPLFRRIGSSIKRRASSSNASPIKHRSMVKLKYKPSVLAGTTAAPAGSNANATRSQALVLALLDRNHSEDRKNEKDDTLVVCSMDGELRQYSVKNDGSIGLIQIEDVLAGK
eukprot:CAMPEP_0201937886 /NCGR_PEP_ID=MMETSP0903-20130614/40334_1 /ASSEMBLY_ACC=CAM_ASM_000552 /TAXON_ID=420261 /ORGANISM="Thalassiosira antarctica, Strain CCMP982" /LENGTH=609 /DNA_ID=CAMNT_0048478989 /DNA_START=156 /DNA_END=1985 /DNA_ORIENTATION=+